jgi:methionine-rich copper-binding protein CopC
MLVLLKYTYLRLLLAACVIAILGYPSALLAQNNSDIALYPQDGQTLNWSPTAIEVHYEGDSVTVVKDLKLTLRPDTQIYINSEGAIENNVQLVQVPMLRDGVYTISWSVESKPMSQSFTVNSGILAPSESATTTSGKNYLKLVISIIVALSASMLCMALLFTKFTKASAKIKMLVVLASLVLVPSVVYTLNSINTTPDSGPLASVKCLAYNSTERNKCLFNIGTDIALKEGNASAMIFLEQIDSDPRFVSANGEHICHEVAHELGRKVVFHYLDVKKSLADSDQTCELGFFHGVVEGAARVMLSDDFYGPVASSCDQALDKSSCAHGIGHSLSIRYSVNMEKSVQLCLEYFKEVDLVDNCVEAVGMSAGEWLGNTLIRTKSFDAAKPYASPDSSMVQWCSFLNDNPSAHRKCMSGLAVVYKAAREGLSYMPNGMSTPSGFAEECLTLTALVDNCAFASGIAVVAYSPDLPTDYSALCDSFAQELYTRSCYSGVGRQARVTVDNAGDSSSYMESICAVSKHKALCLAETKKVQ